MGFPESYDGRLLHAWLKKRGVLEGEGRTVFGRTVNRWGAGENPMYYTVDKWLTARGIHLDEIPEEFAVDPYRQPGMSRPISQMRVLREEGMRLLSEGVQNVEIARRLGVHPRTVGNWRKKMEVEA